MQDRLGDPGQRDVDGDPVVQLESMYQPVSVADGVGHEHLDIATQPDGATGDLAGADHDHPALVGYRMGQFAIGLVTVDRLGRIPRLGSGVGAGQHPRRQPRKRSARRAMFDELTTGEHQFGPIVGDRAQRPGRLTDQRRRLDVTGSCHVPQTLDRVHCPGWYPRLPHHCPMRGSRSALR